MNDEIQKQQQSSLAQFGDSTVAKAIAEVQGAIMVAKQFPRDENLAVEKILTSCKMMRLAEHAIYSYPKGGTQVKGGSIRLMESIARAWGNIDYGILEISQEDGASVIESFAWDKENNIRVAKRFKVKHVRDKNNFKTGEKMHIKLTDARDIYEMTANLGVRRMRACLEAVIPAEIVDLAVQACEKTLGGGNGVDLTEKIGNMVKMFKEFKVTENDIKMNLGHNIESIAVNELTKLGGIYNSIKDGMGTAESFFPSMIKKEKPAEGKGNSSEEVFD